MNPFSNFPSNRCGLICWIPKCCSHVGGWCKRRSFADGDLFGLPLSWPTGSFLVIFEMFRLGWSAFPKTIRTRNLSFAYKKKTRKKWKYNHLKSKSQLYFRNELLPGRVCGVLLIRGAGSCGPLICVQQSGLAASGSGAEARQLASSGSVSAVSTQRCPPPHTPPPPLDTAPPHQAKCHSAR